ncbi:MAG: chemotaxis protein CheA [Gemmatimonadaceae bacterium]
MDISRYAELFLTESREHLSAINDQLLELERAPGVAEPVNVIFRSVHTVKGMSATMGYSAVTSLAHALETLLDGMRAEQEPATGEIIELLFKAVDLLESVVELAVQGRDGEIEVDQLVAQLSEILPFRTAAGPAAGAAMQTETAANGTAYARGEPSVSGRETNQIRHARIDVRRLDNLMNLIGELVIAKGGIVQIAERMTDPALGEAISQASKLIAQLQHEIVESRLVPAVQVFNRFPRMVRDSARALGKQVDFVLEGQDLELDRSVLDEIGDPILHLLRNAIDHGIEMPVERQEAGKPSAGRVVLSATRERSAIAIRVSDDGKGIDRARVLRRAYDLGLADSSKTELTDDEIMRLVAKPGFSTADRVTNISGRGVGVDIVNSRVRALGGTLEIRSAKGQGTTVTLRLPLTLAIVRALLARVDNETYAIPLTHVNSTVELDRQSTQRMKGKDMLVMRDHVLPLIRFREIARLPIGDDRGKQVIVLELGERRAGLVVDELTGQQEIVVKQFDGVRDAVPVFSGATILGDGEPALIVDVNSLL